VAAGLSSTFTIVWPDPGHAATCPAWTPKATPSWPEISAATNPADSDPRVTCTGCRWYAGRCLRHRAAGLPSDQIGPALAALPQHCPAWAPRNKTET
jgi:hypothetical protein